MLGIGISAGFVYACFSPTWIFRIDFDGDIYDSPVAVFGLELDAYDRIELGPSVATS
jgi:hypothetical protein